MCARRKILLSPITLRERILVDWESDFDDDVEEWTTRCINLERN